MTSSMINVKNLVFHAPLGIYMYPLGTYKNDKEKQTMNVRLLAREAHVKYQSAAGDQTISDKNPVACDQTISDKKPAACDQTTILFNNFTTVGEKVE
jgi:hypothetical protein